MDIEETILGQIPSTFLHFFPCIHLCACLSHTYLFIKGRPLKGLPWWLSGKEAVCQCRGHRFHPWSGNTPHAKEHLRPFIPTIEPMLYSMGAATPEPKRHNDWSPRARALQLGKPPRWDAHALHGRENPCSNKNPAQAENKQINTIKKKIRETSQASP